MEDTPVRPPFAGFYRALNVLFWVLAALGVLYIFWRGFAAEAGRRGTPLFGQRTFLEWEGAKRPFVLVEYAEMAQLKPGDLVTREREVPTKVWQVASNDTQRVRLVSGDQEREVPLPASRGGARYVLLVPAPASEP